MKEKCFLPVFQFGRCTKGETESVRVLSWIFFDWLNADMTVCKHIQTSMHVHIYYSTGITQQAQF
jgi:hypothetical protein